LSTGWPGASGEGSCHQKEDVTCKGSLIAAVTLSKEPVTFDCRDKHGMEHGVLYKED